MQKVRNVMVEFDFFHWWAGVFCVILLVVPRSCKKMTPYHQPLYRIILRINWLVMAVIACVQLSRIPLYHVPIQGEVISLSLLAGVAVMAPLIAKIDAPYKRFLCALLEMLFCLVAACFGVARLYPILYVTVLARYSMLLNVPMMLVLVALAAVPNNGFVFLLIRTAVLKMTPVEEHVVAFDPITSIAQTALYVAALILFVMAIRYLNIEQDSRKQAQRLMLEIKDMATELERSRLAREIHDSLGHTLTALNMQLEVFSTLHKTNPAQAMAAFDTARRLASDILEDVRAVVHSIRHQDFQFEKALRGVIDQSQQLNDANLTLAIETADIPPGSAYQLYNIARECLTNSIKHASARNIGISVRENNNTILLECSDDGAGFDATESNSKGHGLRGMKERAESLGGTLTVESSAGRGTRISVSVPKVHQINDSCAHS
jgi:signal transduction histidine kinase